MIQKQLPKKRQESGSGQFQMKTFAIWGLLIVGIWALNIFTAEPSKTIQLSIHQILEAASKNMIKAAEIQSDPIGGGDWYTIKGFLKKSAVDELEFLRPFAQPIKVDQKKPTSFLSSPAKGYLLAFESNGRLTESRFTALVDGNNGIVFKEKPASTAWKSFLMNTLPFVFIILFLYFLFIRQIRMAGKGAMSFGRSRAKLLQEDQRKITFNEVAGCDEAKQDVREIVDFLKDPKKFERIGGRIPKGCLLIGPPGTGKTLLAKAIAGEADVPFFNISGSDFVEMFVGVGAARVRDMFEQAKKSAPCLIFIDEIDAVGRQRGAGLGGGNDEREQTLNSLLVEMDGFDSHEGVIIIAATNRPDVLDSALLRPGRFDRQVVLDLPDLAGREDILKVHAKKIKLSELVDLKIVARNTSGYSGADLENLLNEAALIAARFDKMQVASADIDEARDKISFGRERKKLMDDADKKVTAYHESGHAIVQAIIDDGLLPIHKVTIIPRGQSLGSTMFLPSKDILNQSQKHLLNQICCAMAGRIAEELTFHELTTGASGDIKMATKIARKMVCDWGMSALGMVSFGENHDHVFLGKEITRKQDYSEETAEKIDAEVSRIVQQEYQRARGILEGKIKEMDVLAQALLKYETVEGKHVHEVLKNGTITSPIANATNEKDDTQQEINFPTQPSV